jgi:hypothetical protein
MALVLNGRGPLDAEQTQELMTENNNKEVTQLNAA